jgi:hypothetical protein
MGHLKELYGTRSRQFINGYLAAMDNYAIWKDGGRYIGVMGKELKSAMQEVVLELSEDYDRDSQLIDKFF